MMPLVVLVVLTLVADVPDSAAGEPRVLLHPSVELGRGPLRLEHVARIEGTAEAVERLAGIELGDLPLPGHVRLVSPAGILLQARLAGVPLAAGQFGGAPEVEVRSRARLVPGERVARRAEELLRPQLGAGKGTLVLERLRTPEPVAILPEGGEPEFRLERGDPDRRGILPVQVSVIQDGRRMAIATVAFQVHRYGPALRLRRSVERGETICAQHLIDVDTELPPTDHDLLGSVAELDGRVARRPLPAGRLLRMGDLEEPVLAERGDTVFLVLEQGALRVEARGVAVRGGRRGDRIMVRRGDADRLISVELAGRRASGEAYGHVQ